MPTPRLSLWRLLAANFYDLRLLLRESRFSLLGFSLLAALGTCYFLFGYDDYERSGAAPFTPLSALYETVRMLVFQSSLPLPQGDPLGRLIFFLLPLLGLALVFQSVLNFGRLLLDKGSRREAWQVALASTYRDHVIVVGLGRIGYRVMSQLQETGYEVVVVEREWGSEFVSAALGRRVPVVLGDARLASTLEQAGLHRARGLVTTTSDDLLNIEIALTAQRERETLQIVLRIFDDQLDSGLERGFGRNSAFSTSALAAPTLAAAAVSRNLAHVLVHDGLLTGIAEVTIEADSMLSGFVHTVEKSYNVRLLQQRRAGRVLPLTKAISRLEGGDEVLLLGSLDALERARLENQGGNKLQFLREQPLQRPTSQFDTVMVCGLGKVGYRVLRQLQQLSPRPEVVVVSDQGTDAAFVDAVRALGVRFVQGDARDGDLLLAAGLRRAYSVVALTSDPLVNIQIALAARRLRGDVHVVLRVFSDVLAERLALLFGIHTAYSASELAAPTLSASALAADVVHGVRVGDKLFVQVVLPVAESDPLAGRTVEELSAEGVLVLSIRRAGAVLPSAPGELLREGDDISLLVALPKLRELRGASQHNLAQRRKDR